MPWGMHSIRGKIHRDMLCQDYESKTRALQQKHTWETNMSANSSFIGVADSHTPEQLSAFWSSLQSNIYMKFTNSCIHVWIPHTWRAHPFFANRVWKMADLPIKWQKKIQQLHLLCATLMPTIFLNGYDCLTFCYLLFGHCDGFVCASSSFPLPLPLLSPASPPP